MAEITLSAAISGKKKVLLSWTYGSNASFDVFWKKSRPAGSDFVLLTSTNAFSFETAELDSSITYSFYVRAMVGETFFYSNTVELFVSCGKGVVLTPDPPPSPPAQWQHALPDKGQSEGYSYRSDNFPYGEWTSVSGVIYPTYFMMDHYYTMGWNGSYNFYDHFEFGLYLFFPLNIPRYATVESADISLWIAEGGPWHLYSVLPLIVKAYKSDNCPYATENSYPTANDGTAWRLNYPGNCTTAYGTISFPAGTYNAADEIEYRTSDLKAVLQEIVNRAGWVSGNKIGIYIRYNGPHSAWNAVDSNQGQILIRGPDASKPPAFRYAYS